MRFIKHKLAQSRLHLYNLDGSGIHSLITNGQGLYRPCLLPNPFMYVYVIKYVLINNKIWFWQIMIPRFLRSCRHLMMRDGLISLVSLIMSMITVKHSVGRRFRGWKNFRSDPREVMPKRTCNKYFSIRKHLWRQVFLGFFLFFFTTFITNKSTYIQLVLE